MAKAELTTLGSVCTAVYNSMVHSTTYTLDDRNRRSDTLGAIVRYAGEPCQGPPRFVLEVPIPGARGHITRERTAARSKGATMAITAVQATDAGPPPTVV